MLCDIRDGELYREAEAFYTAVRGPQTGQISDATEVHASPDGRYAVFSGVLTDKLEGVPPTRICRTELASGHTQILTFGPNADRFPRWSPDGQHIAFLSDRNKAGDFQLYLLEIRTGAARAAPVIDGWVEYLQWSPDGTRILLGVAAHGADVGGAQGAVTSKQLGKGLPPWIPEVETGEGDFRWRGIWIYELATNTMRRLEASGANIWEATWCGREKIAVVASPGPGEGLWYSATLQIVDVASGERREIYKPRDQLGWPAASPSGRHVAFGHAICSDRGLVAGDLIVIDMHSGRPEPVDTSGVDVTYAEWRSDTVLLLAGHRGFDTVVGLYDVRSGAFREIWASRDVTAGGFYARVSGLNNRGDCILVGESFIRAPELATLCEGNYRTIRSFDLGYAEYAQQVGGVECITWKASDGLELQGWLLTPKGPGPHPLVLNIHGGPVWQFRPAWLGRNGAALVLLLKRGFAIFQPNPRGSTGRGQAFARRVIGEMGGAETTDHLSGLDHLIAKGVADPKRLGVTGGSHGGFMTSWIIGQDTRFAAAVAVAPVTNWVSEHLTCNIPHFAAIALKDKYTNPTGKYCERSPVMHAHKVKTPTLSICGALDRCTPPTEAVQFHNALLENGVKSVLVTYPAEGHGVRSFPAMIDYAARIVEWFVMHIAK